MAFPLAFSSRIDAIAHRSRIAANAHRTAILTPNGVLGRDSGYKAVGLMTGATFLMQPRRTLAAATLHRGEWD